MRTEEPAFTPSAGAPFEPKAGHHATAFPRVTRRTAGKLFHEKKIRDGRRMLLIAVGLTVALVTADLLDLTRRGDERRRGVSLRK